MAAKVAAPPRRRGVSIRTALVYEGHLAPIVEADGYFDAIVPSSLFSRRPPPARISRHPRFPHFFIVISRGVW